jgi:hypothetical protein
MGRSVTATDERFRSSDQGTPADWLNSTAGTTMSAQDVWLSRDTGSLIPPRRRSPTWLADVIDDLLDWLNEPEGWDSYSASSISPGAVSTAARFLRGIATYGVPRPFITGDSDGGVSGSWESDRYSVQLDFHEASIDLFFWDKYVDEQWEGSLNSAVDRLGPILWYLSHGGA